MQAFMGRWLVPSNWRRIRVERGGNEDDDGLSDDGEFLPVEGEELGSVFADTDNAAARRHDVSGGGQYANQADSTSRLSRE